MSTKLVGGVYVKAIIICCEASGSNVQQSVHIILSRVIIKPRIRRDQHMFFVTKYHNWSALVVCLRHKSELLINIIFISFGYYNCIYFKQENRIRGY